MEKEEQEEQETQSTSRLLRNFEYNSSVALHPHHPPPNTANAMCHCLYYWSLEPCTRRAPIMKKEREKRMRWRWRRPAGNFLFSSFSFFSARAFERGHSEKDQNCLARKSDYRKRDLWRKCIPILGKYEPHCTGKCWDGLRKSYVKNLKGYQKSLSTWLHRSSTVVVCREFEQWSYFMILEGRKLLSAGDTKL